MSLPPKIFEDDSFIAFDKPAGLSVGGHGLMEAIRQRGLHDVVNVHRLEEEASGLVLCAKDKPALDYLSGQFQSKTVIRKYLAIVQIRTDPPVLPEHFAVEVMMGPDEAKPGFVRAYGRKEAGKVSRSEFSVRSAFYTRSALGTTRSTLAERSIPAARPSGPRFTSYALLECRPETSLLHQLRFHLSHYGAPLAGETVYAEPPALLLLSSLKRGYKGRDEEKPLVGRLALHASELTFRHPVTRELVTLTAPLPHEFDVALKYLAKFAASGTGSGSRSTPPHRDSPRAPRS